MYFEMYNNIQDIALLPKDIIKISVFCIQFLDKNFDVSVIKKQQIHNITEDIKVHIIIFDDYDYPGQMNNNDQNCIVTRVLKTLKRKDDKEKNLNCVQNNKYSGTSNASGGNGANCGSKKTANNSAGVINNGKKNGNSGYLKKNKKKNVKKGFSGGNYQQEFFEFAANHQGVIGYNNMYSQMPMQMSPEQFCLAQQQNFGNKFYGGDGRNGMVAQKGEIRPPGNFAGLNNGLYPPTLEFIPPPQQQQMEKFTMNQYNQLEYQKLQQLKNQQEFQQNQMLRLQQQEHQQQIEYQKKFSIEGQEKNKQPESVNEKFSENQKLSESPQNKLFQQINIGSYEYQQQNYAGTDGGSGSLVSFTTNCQQSQQQQNNTNYQEQEKDIETSQNYEKLFNSILDQKEANDTPSLKKNSSDGKEDLESPNGNNTNKKEDGYNNFFMNMNKKQESLLNNKNQQLHSEFLYSSKFLDQEQACKDDCRNESPNFANKDDYTTMNHFSATNFGGLFTQDCLYAEDDLKGFIGEGILKR